jgi:glutamyl aminopeptidase
MKAKFKVFLTLPKNPEYFALSNMDVEKEQTETDHRVVEFKESVKMSTYLAAFIVSDFANIKTEIVPKEGLGDKFNLAVYATREQIKNKNADFALDTAKKIMEYYIDYFQIPYPLPKLDLAAIPDFPSGAMETWGLVTFRQTSILYDSATSSTANKERVASVISHELAHMWFGNLVTMKWWNDLWLNEGFASYIEYKGVNAAHPDWKIVS